MSYKAKSGVKHERKLGLQAIKELLADKSWSKDRILAMAKQNEDAFGKLDELNNDDFCVAMNDMRQNHTDLYRVFWWWRKAHEDASKQSEDDFGDKPETRYGAFMITQFLAEPFSDKWEDDRQNLKPGIVPFITDAQIASGLDHKSIKRYAGIWHDIDTYTEEDEIADRSGRIKAGDAKYKHVHYAIELSTKVPISTIARWFGVAPQYVQVLHGRGAFLDAVEYLVHESPKAVEQGKTHYDDDAVDASPGFDFRKELNDLQANRLKFGRRAGDMSPVDTMRMHVLLDGWTLRQCKQDDPITYAKIRNNLKDLRLDYLQDATIPNRRLTIYIDGNSDAGKSKFSKWFAEQRYGADSWFAVGASGKVTFDGYDGQPVVIWNEARADTLVSLFGYEGVYDIFDPYPEKQAYHAKFGRVILTNELNIINGIEPWHSFREKLIEPDRDPIQSYKRLQMIIVLHDEDYDIHLNRGYLYDDRRLYDSFLDFKHIRGSLPRILASYRNGPGVELMRMFFAEPIAKLAMLETKKDNKIEDSSYIPPEFADYGKYMTVDEVEAQAEAKLAVASEEDARHRYEVLIRFAEYLWDFNEYTPGLVEYGTFFNYRHYDPRYADLPMDKRDDAHIVDAQRAYIRWLRNDRSALTCAISHVPPDLFDRTELETFSHELICNAVEYVWVRMDDEGHAVIEDDDYTPTEEATKEAFAELGIELVDDAGKDNG